MGLNFNEAYIMENYLVFFKEYIAKGSYKVAVKVIDIFGNDTTKVIEVSL